jgi:hypothetical protein
MRIGDNRRYNISAKRVSRGFPGSVVLQQDSPGVCFAAKFLLTELLIRNSFSTPPFSQALFALRAPSERISGTEPYQHQVPFVK